MSSSSLSDCSGKLTGLFGLALGEAGSFLVIGHLASSQSSASCSRCGSSSSSSLSSFSGLFKVTDGDGTQQSGNYCLPFVRGCCEACHAAAAILVVDHGMVGAYPVNPEEDSACVGLKVWKFWIRRGVIWLDIWSFCLDGHRLDGRILKIG